MFLLELWIRNTHTPPHTFAQYTWPIFSCHAVRFPSFFPRGCSPAEGGPIWRELSGGNTFYQFNTKWVSFFFVLFLCRLPPLPLQLSNISLTSQLSGFFFLLYFSVLSTFSRIHIYLCAFNAVFLSLMSVWGNSIFPNVAFWTHKMTLWCLSPSTLSYSSSIIPFAPTSL